MGLTVGTYVNLLGRFDEETWEDQATHEKKSSPVLIVDEIEFCHNGNGKQSDDGTSVANTTADAPEQQPSGTPPENFTGFESFGGVNPFFPGN